MSRRLKVLISAYACEPHKGSEPAVGWNWVQQLARHHDLWVLTRANNRHAIEQETFARTHPNVHWVYYDLPGWLRFWKRGGRGIQLYYYLWQIGIYFVARRLHRRVGFDLIHHVTMVRYWTPSFLAFLPVRMIFGPVGGGETAPASFYRSFAALARIQERVRDVVRWCAEHEPLTRAAVRRATATFATTEQTARRLDLMGARNVTVLPPFALSRTEFDYFDALPAKPAGPFRVISMGRLLHWKGFDLGLRAFARFSRTCPECEYWIVNDGPDGPRLKELARTLGIQERVTFWGKLPALADVHLKLAKSDVLAHPSLHDNFGNVCLEAMAAGKPVICLDWGGPALQVTEACGFKVPAKNPEQAVADIEKAMKRLWQDAQLREQMGRNGRQRAREFFLWEQKAAEMNRVYLMEDQRSSQVQ